MTILKGSNVFENFAENCGLDMDIKCSSNYKKNFEHIEKTKNKLIESTKDLLKELYVKQSLLNFPAHISQQKMLKQLKKIYLQENLKPAQKYEYLYFDEDWKNSNITQLKEAYLYKQKVDESYNKYEKCLKTIENVIKKYHKNYDINKEIEKFNKRQLKKESEFPGLGSTGESGSMFVGDGNGGGFFM